MDDNGHLEVSGVQLQRVQGHDDPQGPNQNAPILMVRDYPPSSLRGALDTGRVARSDIDSLLSERQRQELVHLFFRFVQPVFPILLQSPQVYVDDQCKLTSNNTTSLALSACIYATALPFAIHNDYLNATLTDTSGKRELLYTIAITAMLEEANTPSIENLQACLLLLQKGPTIQQQGLTPTYSWFVSLAVIMAKSLGLQHDCSSWNIPPVEKQLRQRLWWANFMMDFWIGVDTPGGRSICSQDYDVLLPEKVTFSQTTYGDCSHFVYLVSLTHLLSQIHEMYYTVCAAKETSSDLFKSLELAKPLRSTLNECKQVLNANVPLTAVGEPGACGSVHLACCVASIILFRALLRPIRCNFSARTSIADSQRSAASAIMTGSINCAREAVELLENLASLVGPWNEFWHSWSQGNFAIVSTFLVQLMVMSDAEHSTRSEIIDIVSRWKRAIRIGAGSGGWGSSLMSMALSRLDSLLSLAST